MESNRLNFFVVKLTLFFFNLRKRIYTSIATMAAKTVRIIFVSPFFIRRIQFGIPAGVKRGVDICKNQDLPFPEKEKKRS